MSSRLPEGGPGPKTGKKKPNPKSSTPVRRGGGAVKVKRRRSRQPVSPLILVIAGLFGFAVVVFGLDILQKKYGNPSVISQMLTLSEDKGLFSSEQRQARADELRRAVNEALIETGIRKSDLVFQKYVAKGTPEEYEYREFSVSDSVQLDSLAARVEQKSSSAGARIVASETATQRTRRVLAVDVGFGCVKRQCLFFIQPLKTEKAPIVERPPAQATPIPAGAISSGVVGQEPVRIALIVDDCGYDLSLARRLARIDIPLTLSIIPGTTFAEATAGLAKDAGLEVMLHLPMEPVQRTDPHVPDIEIRCGQSSQEVENLIAEALASVPSAVGVNNHEGSRACTDRPLMAVLMPQFKERGLYFVDSRTAPETVAFLVAKRVGLRAASRDIFLDNENDKEAIAWALEASAALSRRAQRPVIGICHLRRTTVSVLEEQLPRLKKTGHRFLLASQVVE